MGRKPKLFWALKLYIQIELVSNMNSSPYYDNLCIAGWRNSTAGIGYGMGIIIIIASGKSL